MSQNFNGLPLSSHILVYTPAPYPIESARGYVLRLSEENGYCSPDEMLRLGVCIAGEERSSRISFSLLSSLVGRHEDELARVAYSTKERQEGRRFKVGEYAVHSMHMQTKSTHVCPECIKEFGYVPVYFDLRYAIACPIHHRYTISKCSRCGEYLTMSRPGLLICKCGNDFSESAGAIADSNSLLGLLSYIWNRLSSDVSAPKACVDSGVPVKSLDKLDLDTLLGVLLRLGRGNFTRIDHKFNAREVIESASNALADWPKGLHSYLISFGADKDNLKSLSFTGQFGQLYNSLFKTKMDKEAVSFIREELASFAKYDWDKAVTNTNVSAGVVRIGDVVGVAGAAKYIGVQPSTLRNLVDEQIIRPIGISEKRGGSMLFKITRDTPRRTDKGHSYNIRNAASELGIYPGVLFELRRQGIYKVKRLGAKVNSFNDLDIKEFRKVVGNALSKAGKMKFAKKNYMSIAEVMNAKGDLDSVKARILGKVISGDVDVYCNSSDKTFDNVILSKQILQQCINQERMSRGGYVPKYHASRLISCEHGVIRWLVDNNYLHSKESNAKQMISVASIAKFNEGYVACSELAKKHRTSSRAISSVCNRHNIMLLCAEREHMASCQPFLAHSDVPLVLSLLGK